MFTADRLKRAADQLLTVVDADRERMLADSKSLFERLEVNSSEPPPLPVSPVYMMLAGLALENLLKGLRIAIDPKLIQPGPKPPYKMFPPPFSQHLDRTFVAHTRVTLTPLEEDLIDRLAVFVAWGGRYPVGNAALDIKSVSTPAGERRAPAMIYGTDPPMINRLFNRLRAELGNATDARRSIVSQEDARRRQVCRRELLENLGGAAYERIESERVIHFRIRDSSAAALNEPGSLVLCCGCGASMTLNSAHPAALCRCDILYHAVPYFNAAVGREMLDVKEYPAE